MLTLTLGIGLAFSPGVHGAEVAAASSTNRYTWRAAHDPDGIGKFYLGREIARVMGHPGAAWLERTNRDAEEHTTALVKALKLKPELVVADIGAGTGYFSRRIAPLIQPGGRVLAVDIQPEMLEALTNHVAKLGLTNIVAVLGTEKDPKLPADSVDLALLVDVYHEFEHPFEMMEAIVRATKPGGRIMLVEYRAEDPHVPIKPVHKITEAQVKAEMRAYPVRFVENIPDLPRQHILVFERIGGQR